ncbi:MAG: desulfoferrodoxin FeS4 iron-binding domain-containing protein [Candidatus Omnitrophica bacterium]|nr:desulfoferrodoxin FeS4 iron-binding domain-containing protein [Candidatus Omnitrophota bacterium]
MAKVKNVGEVYKCDICGNVVEIKEVGGGELVCCQQAMVKIEG